MKAKLLALSLIAISSSSFAGPPDMVFSDANGSTLTIQNFVPPATGGPAKAAGIYFDNVGLGGCDKGKSYKVLLSLTGGMNDSSASFNSPLCEGVSLKFTGAFPAFNPNQPPPVPVITATLDVTSSTTSQFNPQM